MDKSGIKSEINRKLDLFDSEIQELSKEQQIILNKLKLAFNETKADYSTRNIWRLTKDINDISSRIKQITGFKSQLIDIQTKL